jgi:hypothetical protein
MKGKFYIWAFISGDRLLQSLLKKWMIFGEGMRESSFYLITSGQFKPSVILLIPESNLLISLGPELSPEGKPRSLF